MADYAEEVTDLREAQRIIAQLRCQIDTLIEEYEQTENEFTALLDEEHAAMLRNLFERGKLYAEQEEDEELIDAFSEFVTGWIDVRWNMVQIEELGSQITPSA